MRSVDPSYDLFNPEPSAVISPSQSPTETNTNTNANTDTGVYSPDKYHHGYYPLRRAW